MRDLCDFMIIQREQDGFGKARFSGTFKMPENGVIVARVMREDDNMTVVPWQKCEVEGEQWLTEFSVPQGGLYRAEARFSPAEQSPNNNNYDWGRLIACVYHFGVGDIFVMAGQSNMSGYARDPAYDPPQLGVHLFDNSGKWVIAAQPLNSVPDPIYCNNDDSSGSSPGLSFGRMMSKELGVPVGLVAAARGGSALASWNPSEVDPDLYYALVEKIASVGKIAGMIWYQGCNETGEQEDAETYFQKFEQTVSLWREKFGHFPIVTCQLNRHAWKEADLDRRWGMVREAQRQVARKIKDVYIVPTADMGTVDGIHNSGASCVAIGERIACVYLKGYYGRPGAFAPSVKRIKRIDSRNIHISFDEPHMLRTMDDNACGLNIEDENGLMDCVKIRVCDDGAIVTAEKEFGENAVFHAYWKREEPAFFIRDIYGMPMLSCYGVPIE